MGNDLREENKKLKIEVGLLRHGYFQLKDVTQKLKESEARYRSYVDNSPISVFVCDEMGRYLDVNPATKTITGYSKKELLSMSISDVLPIDTQEFGLKLFQKLKDEGRVNAEFPFKRKNGSVGIWLLEGVRLSPIRYMGLCTDVTERKKAEEALLQKNRELEEMNRLMVDREIKMIELKEEIERLRHS